MSEPKSVDRTIRIVTHQHVVEGLPLPPEGFPVRQWSIEVYLLDEQGNEVPANIFDKVTYHLHPTFANPVRVIKKQPFKIEEQGWGEFELGITFTFVDKAGDRKVAHDLNFLQEKYEVDHVIHCPLKSEKLKSLLAESGAVPSVDASSGDKRKATGTDSNKAKRAKPSGSALANAVKGSVDLEKLAEGLTKLSEDDLLGVVQMVTDNRTPDMNIKNDVEGGEFTMDLYTLPDSLLKSLWEYVKKRIE
ncbi:Transcription initiation factor TFIID subunit 14 AltName: Full=TBP-associated factor 14; AltName: Full=TBP-associated factor 30 kDa; AltName: Full=Transcription initiation factor TFIIF 30 kDa subunit; AltName: Full=Transcription factor G 30 kDa subunit; AltName: Full=SWI/SNF chromatin-remodeling complex subunit TAF14; AltName: Full=SWI/SNF complex subunit TAF14; AltName: Full=SWI/SNF complex 29 kDa subunit; AltName: Full=Actin non-complementing mutant 1; AltName: Full=Chromosome stability protein 10 [Cyber|uniref:YEATS domain-containing protein n=1 Tax=Cyberlindnera jadinii (strain ATCC 18201 / CBS 1600 / BCRC 20928 / JCM 3617 / NBRC 0987 / NRRL Y-1542) TaxID=983966 RepID=A0A0H5C0X1_CYBJN|nr:Transcription initiation factor TFIID subunit 14 AltName: Full=TBP-associated factor 14; AltName: Full=TBP-associated factor 30 kDa; AltName: Full=Transcription initiation factor TFIIF 30 kDa subunit; AltName: Full=Transcription factor G 30 kDa subunit; AltName: Full=SWI/SNF chromatin-remodeling complex subunit TAF14; AltName: Full=SWI/SNF complex subunit TAF14; AltName: Full=SWI/SNF complex 29 kDa subunit; AltName: Full=Actin non-complementing mutant 1; AltName: Full=Chromosome stability protei